MVLTSSITIIIRISDDIEGILGTTLVAGYEHFLTISVGLHGKVKVGCFVILCLKRLGGVS